MSPDGATDAHRLSIQCPISPQVDQTVLGTGSGTLVGLPTQLEDDRLSTKVRSYNVEVYSV